MWVCACDKLSGYTPRCWTKNTYLKTIFGKHVDIHADGFLPAAIHVQMGLFNNSEIKNYTHTHELAEWSELTCDSIKYYRLQWKFPYKLAIFLEAHTHTHIYSIHFLPSFDLNPHYFVPQEKKNFCIRISVYTFYVRGRKNEAKSENVSRLRSNL